VIEIDAAELLAASRTAFERSDGANALEQLGYWDLLPTIDDPTCLRAVMATFEAAGMELASSTALAGLVGLPYADVLGTPVRAAVPSSRSNGSIRHVLVGPVEDVPLLVDTPGVGAAVVPVDEVRLRELRVPGKLVLHEVVAVDGGLDVRLDEAASAPIRRRAIRLGRLALAFEMLGAARAALELAVEHARTREQFGSPIGTFQAVQHLLAWAATDCEAIAGAAEHALEYPDDEAFPAGVMVKALAGRNAMAACERSLQVLGAVGFTAELDHHHFHSRVLALDSMLGTRAELTCRLGEEWRTDPSDRRIPTVALGYVGAEPR
jgi:hypothetical protein